MSHDTLIDLNGTEQSLSEESMQCCLRCGSCAANRKRFAKLGWHWQTRFRALTAVSRWLHEPEEIQRIGREREMEGGGRGEERVAKDERMSFSSSPR